MRVRNAEGREGVVAWEKIRAAKNAPVRPTYGYATTIDTAQGMTSAEHIHALPRGSAAIASDKNYTAMSQHQISSWLVIDEASERRQIAQRIPLGQHTVIRASDVWNNIAANLGRANEKALAPEFMARATDVHRGALRGRRLIGRRHELAEAAPTADQRLSCPMR